MIDSKLTNMDRVIKAFSSARIVKKGLCYFSVSARQRLASDNKVHDSFLGGGKSEEAAWANAVAMFPEDENEQDNLLAKHTGP